MENEKTNSINENTLLKEKNFNGDNDISRGREKVNSLINKKQEDVFLVGDYKIDSGESELLWWNKDSINKKVAEKKELAEKKQDLKQQEAVIEEYKKNNNAYRQRLEAEKRRFEEERKNNNEKYKQEEKERQLKREKELAEAERQRLKQEEEAQSIANEIQKRKDELERKKKEELELRIQREHELKLTQIQKRKEIEAQQQRMREDEAEAGLQARELALLAEKRETEKILAREQEIIENLDREYKQMYARAEELAIERAKKNALMNDYAAMSEEKRIADLKRMHSIYDVAFLPYKKDYGAFGADNIMELHEISFIKSENGKIVVDMADFNIANTGITIVSGFSREQIDGIVSIIRRDYDKEYIISGGEMRYNGVIATDMKRSKYHELTNGAFYVMPNSIGKTKNILKTVNMFIKSEMGKNYDENKVLEFFETLNVKSPSKLLVRPLVACSVSELTKVYLTGAFLTDARIVMLCEPQRYLDCVSRLALVGKIKDWNTSNPKQSLVIFTSDKAIIEVNATLVRRIIK